MCSKTGNQLGKSNYRRIVYLRGKKGSKEEHQEMRKGEYELCNCCHLDSQEVIVRQPRA